MRGLVDGRRRLDGWTRMQFLTGLGSVKGLEPLTQNIPTERKFKNATLRCESQSMRAVGESLAFFKISAHGVPVLVQRLRITF